MGKATGRKRPPCRARRGFSRAPARPRSPFRPPLCQRSGAQSGGELLYFVQFMINISYFDNLDLTIIDDDLTTVDYGHVITSTHHVRARA